MSDSSIALGFIFLIVFGGTALGLAAARHRQVNLEQWAVAGRGLGLILVWILLAGETFTTFSVLGISGWTYSKGGPILYALTYLTLGQVLTFFAGPAIWEVGRRYRLQNIGDYFAQRYQSRALAAVVAVAGVVFLTVYLQLQLTGLGTIVRVASFETIDRTQAMEVSSAVIAVFVLLSGVRGVVWVSFLKDFLLVAVALVVGLGIPYLRFGGIGAMFDQLLKARPAFFTMPGATADLDHRWFVTTVLINSLFFTWPHFFGNIFTAKSGDTVRRNSMLMPLYVLPLLLIILAGCAAILIAPGLPNGDLALLTAVRTTFPPWVLGIIGGAGALTAIVPASIMILTSATLVAKNVYKAYFKPDMNEREVMAVARVSVFVLTAIALTLSLHSSTTLVGLLIMAYSGVAQFAPGIVLALCSKRVTTPAILTGLIAGLAVSGVLSFTHRDPFHGFNAGFLALALNMALVVAISAITRPGVNGFEIEPET